MSKVQILMGSKSDIEVAEKAKKVLEEFGVEVGMAVASAHRTPARVESIVNDCGADVFIAIAGLSAALPGVVAAHTIRPVIGIPVSGKVNMDSLLSVVQMPPGIPVAGVGLDRGENAALLAVQIIAVSDQKLEEKMIAYRKKMAEKVVADSEEVC